MRKHGIGHTVEFTPAALEDLEEIWDYVAADSPLNADRLHDNLLKAAAGRYPSARRYRDWRELFAQEAEKIDAVCVSTPDHAHAPVAMTALKLGKHVFCEKPLTHELYEARQLTLAARDAGVATQMGIQIHSHQAYRTAVQWLRDGHIGKVKEWHSWASARGSAPDLTMPESEDPPPAHLAWDLWLGVAPARPYKAELYHPGRWRHWQDFGSGAIGDFACHIFDPVFTALGIGAPISVRAEVSDTRPAVWPTSQTVYYEFPGTPMTTGETITATWYDGGRKPPRELAPLPEGQDLPDSGSLLIGDGGVMLLPHYKQPILLPVEQFFDRWICPLLAIESFLETTLDEPFANVLDSLCTAIQSFCDLAIRPAFVGLQQNVRPLYLLAASFQPLDDFVANFAFLLC